MNTICCQAAFQKITVFMQDKFYLKINRRDGFLVV